MMEGDSVRGRRLKHQLLLIGCAMVLSISAGTTNASAATHVFDPHLSLTGDCSISAVDEVPDPGPCPGTSGIDHPNAAIQRPHAVTTDSYGNIYVAAQGASNTSGRIDVFDSAGFFITEIADPLVPDSLAVDSAGNLYVTNHAHEGKDRVVRYGPTGTYNPTAGEVKYSDPPSEIIDESISVFNAVAVNPANDHLFVKYESRIEEYESAADGNDFIETIAAGEVRRDGVGLAVDAAHGQLYASTERDEGGEFNVIKVFDLAFPHALLFTIKPPVDTKSYLSVAADEGSGHVFVYDGPAKKVYEFDEDGVYLNNIIEHSFENISGGEIGVDNGKFSPNGALNLTERYLYVPSHPGGTGHSFAFGPSNEGEPSIESVSFANVGDADAELEALIKPVGLDTHYTFEYITQQRYEEEGNNFTGAHLVGEGSISAASSLRDVAIAVEGLEPGTRYRFRVFAENTGGSDEAEGEFATYVAAEPFAPCANGSLRTGVSALLPDCRAYELVTPPDTNARAPLGLGHAGSHFATRGSAPGGDQVSFQIEGGTLPGSEGTGSLGGDPYLSTRAAGGWGTTGDGPNGSEATGVLPGSHSPDQGYSFWSTSGGGGSAAIGDASTSYTRYPDGHSALVGRGGLGTDPRAVGKLISEGGGHIIFVSGSTGLAIQLEPNAPLDGTKAVYDRTVDEVTHVVSLLPGDETPEAGEDATYAGASLDGRGVAFKIGARLYLRYEDEETYELGEGTAFAGIAEGGARAFYLKGGQLWRFDATNEERTPFSSGPVTPVNVSADGSTAYFVSTTILTANPNPNGAVAQVGKENLYRSEEGDVSFVATVTHRDVVGESNGNEQVEGLGLWTDVVGEGRLAADPSRTTPNGHALLFESRADLDGYDPGEHAEVYRYDLTADELDCLSCNPTLAAAASDASLQSISAERGDPEPFTSFGYVANLRPDGRRAFFQSEEALAPADVDGLQDVYEWEAQGTGSCNRRGGCVYLVSSGHSLRIDDLFAVSDSGDNVFFRTSDILLPRDAEETPSIYDARVGGGFPEPVDQACEGEACRPGLSPAAAGQNFGSQGGGPSGNSEPACPKSKRKVRRHGKATCVKKKHKHPNRHHHKGTGKSRGAGK
jgi:hypothetical protein